MDSKKINSKKSGIFLQTFEAVLYVLIVHFSYLFIMYVDIQNKYYDYNIEAYQSVWYIVTLLTLGVFLFNRMYQTFKLSKTENTLIIITSTAMIALGITIIAFFFRSFAIPRSVILLGFFIQTFLFVLVKYSFIFVYNKTKRIKRVVLFCDFSHYESTIEEIFGAKNAYERVEFVCTKKFEDFDINKLDGIDKIYISNTYNSKLLDEYLHEIVLKGIQICIIPSSYDLAITNSKFYLSSDLPLLRIDQIGLSLEHRILKRAIDIIFSVVGLIVTAPIFVVTYIAIYLDGKNVIYKQKRVTFNNKVFTIYKFRTMINDAEKSTGAVWAVENDPRITKLGLFLRKYWIDELPQLFNVLKGDMTFVGPRPERPELIEKFANDYPDFKMRTLVKCGLTGYAQVMARYDTRPEHKLKFDLFYILNASIIFDINIIIMTLRKMVLRFVNQEKSYKDYIQILENWNVSDIVDMDGIVYFNYFGSEDN